MKRLSDFDALSFDCYGTLIDWERGLAEALAPWAENAGLDIGRDRLLETFASYETGVQQAHPGMVYQEVLASVLHRIGDRFAAPVSPETAARFGGSVGEWPAFADSAEALQRLKTRYKLIILSNVDRGSFYLSSLRLGVAFDLVITAQDVGAYKPSPKSFPAMLARLDDIDVRRDRLLHVAQSLFHDHDPARAAGLASVWIDRRHGQEGFGATPAPESGKVNADWRFPSMKAFADAALAEEPASS